MSLSAAERYEVIRMVDASQLSVRLKSALRAVRFIAGTKRIKTAATTVWNQAARHRSGFGIVSPRL
jgi:hypothetical protein